MPSLKLEWDGTLGCYRAKLAAALDLALKPFKLRIESGGRVSIGAVAKASLRVDSSAQAKVDTEAAARGKATAGLDIEPPSIHVSPPKVAADGHASVGTGSGAKAGGKASIKAPSISVTPPSVKAGAAASAKAGAKTGFKLGT
jgi:hypothetical protein